MSSFSQRYRYQQPKPILYQEALPLELLDQIFAWVEQYLTPRDFCELVCVMLKITPDRLNKYDYQFRNEAQSRFRNWEWFRTYDFLEEVYEYLASRDGSRTPEIRKSLELERNLNEFFIEYGVGWQFVNGKIVNRGSEIFEQTVTTAVSELHEDERTTASGQIHESLQALSRRPQPNFRGAIFHSMGAVECIIRNLAGDKKVTLGDALKRYPSLVPKPVDDALAKLWGYASNEARHVAEGTEPSREDVELIVGLAATIATYLTRKNRSA